MAGLTPDDLTHAQVQDELEAHVGTGAALPPAVMAHLAGCPACRAHLELLRDVTLALLEDVPEVTPPPAMRMHVLDAARKTPGPARRWWPAALGVAAAISGVLALGTLLTPSRGTAATLPDPAVVVSTGTSLLIASNDRAGTLSVVAGGRVSASMSSGGREAAWFTEGVRLGDRVFLADAANDRVLEIQPSPLTILRTYSVPDGVAGLTATSGPDGGRVYFKSVRGEVGTLGGARITIATAPGMPLADVMDGVLLVGDALFVTHHLSGEICVLDPRTLAVRRRVAVGGMPVALEAVPGGILALDVTGRLLQLDLDGVVVQTWAVGGHPDKLGVNGDVAILTDRGGTVTRVNLGTGQLERARLAHPMDVVSLPDGGFAVAEGGLGVRVLDTELRTTASIEGSR
ncbi:MULTISPECIES: hypothetical protein [Deinococcus]|uniref:Zinc-finger domain-containing protein n=1 Tax=Deinococcus rufus TaxID=2136097 RepID=A0ABV7Z273_9DEIO|nr:hypothetical protein [Deinococcus sp. AB2017081]WQE95229.1 hypothetical protein U2P90_17880 [Deinococcus sp. AB2017081]